MVKMNEVMLKYKVKGGVSIKYNVSGFMVEMC